MLRALAMLVASVLAALAALHLYWAAGGRFGKAAAVPQLRGRPAFSPGPIACIAVAMLLLAAVLLLLGRSGVIALPTPRWLIVAGAWGVGVTFALRSVRDFRLFGLFRQVGGTQFARNDALIYTPLCIALAIGSLCIAWRGG